MKIKELQGSHEAYELSVIEMSSEREVSQDRQAQTSKKGENEKKKWDKMRNCKGKFQKNGNNFSPNKKRGKSDDKVDSSNKIEGVYRNNRGKK